MHVFTSITSNYLDKASVLASLVKKYHPDFKFHAVLSDNLPQDFYSQKNSKLFDSIILTKDLPMPDFKAWAFKHSLVEMCTAVKGFAFQYIFNKYRTEEIIYLDPDIVVLAPLNELINKFNKGSILLTPHLTVPEDSQRAILDNEICSLQHGVFNLGFLGIKASPQGLEFLNWWSARLKDYCYDDIAGGLFTDQRWADLVPCFFDDLHIIREPQYNVATWNLSKRKVTGSLERGINIDDKPVVFYHFTGFDSGSHKVMLDIYGKHSPVVDELRRWYLQECEKMGQHRYEKIACHYDHFDNGIKISRQHRLLYRTRPDLQRIFPDPFHAAIKKKSYYYWYLDNIDSYAKSTDKDHDQRGTEYYRIELGKAKQELSSIIDSRSWKLLNTLLKPYRKIKKLL